MTTLKQRFTTEIKSKVGESLGIKNVHAIPRLEKIAINVGWGDLKGNEALQKGVIENLALMTGQQPVPTKAKVSIAGFKLREGDLSGYKVTLRNHRMYDFLDRLITYVFPRLRDFQGMPLKGFDGHGNYSFGLKEQSVFPEVPYDQGAKSGGLQITIATSGKTTEEARALLQALGFPFEKKEDK